MAVVGDRVLGRFQQGLQRLYDLEIEHAVQDFLITDRKLACILAPDAPHAGAPERLLVAEREDSLDLSLFLDESLLRQLQEDDPDRRLHSGNLQPYLQVLEGVSHFLYLAWNASRDRSVTMLELELQAEIDKFVSSLLLFSSQHGSAPERLHACLFDNPAYDEALDERTRARYRDANRYAARYCMHLLRQLGHYRFGALLGELRRFYRLPQPRKLALIEAL
ncbi:MAG: hypothetical protein D6786_09755 [Gammaproteobacteria bacterium]|nr:MAG: hypothetical protein D6786_09755 [Gammaproteobacteria bacterium]